MPGRSDVCLFRILVRVWENHVTSLWDHRLNCLLLGGSCVTPCGGVESCGQHWLALKLGRSVSVCKMVHMCCQHPLLLTVAGQRLTPMMSPLILATVPVERLLYRFVWDNRHLCKADISILLRNKLSILQVNMSNRYLWESLCVKICEKVCVKISVRNFGTDCFQVSVCRTFTFFLQQRFLFLVNFVLPWWGRR